MEDKKALDIRFILLVLRERIKVITVVFMAAFLPLLAVSFLVTPIYEVKATLLIEQVPIKMPFNQDAFLFPSRPASVDLKKHSILLRGSAIAGKVARALSAESRSKLLAYTRPGPLSQTVGWIKSIMPTAHPAVVDSTQIIHTRILNMIRKTNLIIIETRAPNIIKIASYADDPALAFELVAKFIRVYSAENLTSNQQEVARALDFVSQQLHKAGNDYQATQSALLAAKRKHDIVTPTAQIEDLELSAKLDHLLYRADLAKEKYNMLATKLMEAEIHFAEISNNIRLVDPPDLPTIPSGRTRLKIRLLAVLAGLVLGLSAGFIVEYFRDLVNGEDDLSRDLQDRIIALIPRLDRDV